MEDGSKITNIKIIVGDYGAVFAQGNFTMNGGTITGCSRDDAIGYLVYITGANASFEMNGSAKISDNENATAIFGGTSPITINGGTISNNTGWAIEKGNITMNGGTITGNGKGVMPATTGTFTMNGGTIKDNTGGVNAEIYMSATAKFIINGPVSIGDAVTLNATATTNNPIIYVGSDFSLTEYDTITINLTGTTGNSGNLVKRWGAEGGRIFLKGGTPTDPTTVTEDQLAKFTEGSAYRTNNYNEPAGTVTLTLGKDDNFGYAKYTANK
jgi:hypothetical protein